MMSLTVSIHHPHAIMIIQQQLSYQPCNQALPQQNKQKKGILHQAMVWLLRLRLQQLLVSGWHYIVQQSL